MKCSRCRTELSLHILRPSYNGFCPRCNYFPSNLKQWFVKNGEAKYCPKVQDGEISEADFEENGCDDCVYTCEIAETIQDIMGLTQDDEGNWGTSDDLDDLEKEE